MKTTTTLARGSGGRVWSFFQDLAQLTDCYPTCWKSLISNSGPLQVFGMHKRHDAREWAEISGCTAEALFALKPKERMLQLRDRSNLRGQRLDYLTDPRYEGGFDDNWFYARS